MVPEIPEQQKAIIMNDAVKPIKDFISARIKSRQGVLNSLAIQPADSVPESIKKMREEEARKIRDIIQELEDILATVNALYPDGAATKEEKG